jgi:hypothetical protein
MTVRVMAQTWTNSTMMRTQRSKSSITGSIIKFAAHSIDGNCDPCFL